TEMQFEKAQIIKQKIDSLQTYQSRSTIVNPRLGNVDVIGMVADDNNFFVNYMMVSRGSIVYAKTIQIKKKLDEQSEDVLSLALDSLRETFQSNAEEVV